MKVFLAAFATMVGIAVVAHFVVTEKLPTSAEATASPAVRLN